jgi:hypothetical protein
VKVRIKTKEEFIKEFGEDRWRDDLDFVEEMDYLFGKIIKLNQKQINDIVNCDFFELDAVDDYTIMSECFEIIHDDSIKIDLSMISCQNIFCKSYGKHYNLNCSKVLHLSDICKVKSCEALKKFIEYFPENN